MKQTGKIFSTAYSGSTLILVEIETIVSGGIYRFEILGLSQKSATELKQKVYTALRSENLLNLKSDNRKIYTSIQADSAVDKSNTAELAILTSCYNCISRRNFYNNTLVLGKISISGEVLSTGALAQSIHIALQNKIKHIVCPQGDFEKVPKRVIDRARQSGVYIEYVSNIKELFTNNTKPLVSEHTEHIHSEESGTLPIKSDAINKIKENGFLWSVFVSICGNHDLLIFINKTIDTSVLFAATSYIHPEYSGEELIQLSHNLNIKDSDIQNIPHYTTTKIDHIKHLHCLMACACENTEKDCTCNVRIKKNYKIKLFKHVEQTETIKITLTENISLSIGDDESSYIKQLIQKIQNTRYIDVPLDEHTLNYYNSICTKMSSSEKKMVLRVSNTIQKIDSIVEGSPVAITKKTILLAFSMIRSKMDF